MYCFQTDSPSGFEHDLKYNPKNSIRIHFGYDGDYDFSQREYGKCKLVLSSMMDKNGIKWLEVQKTAMSEDDVKKRDPKYGFYPSPKTTIHRFNNKDEAVRFCVEAMSWHAAHCGVSARSDALYFKEFPNIKRGSLYSVWKSKKADSLLAERLGMVKPKMLEREVDRETIEDKNRFIFRLYHKGEEDGSGVWCYADSKEEARQEILNEYWGVERLEFVRMEKCKVENSIIEHVPDSIADELNRSWNIRDNGFVEFPNGDKYQLRAKGKEVALGFEAGGCFETLASIKINPEHTADWHRQTIMDKFSKQNPELKDPQLSLFEYGGVKR